MIYQYYDPHPRACHMSQYKCCKYRQHCRLYPICKAMNKETLTSVCKKDCATCDYDGCTMPREKRLTEPLYIDGWTKATMVPLSIDEVKDKERALHKKNYQKLRHMYLKLFSEEYRKKEKIRAAKYREENKKIIRERSKRFYQKNYAVGPKNDKRKKMNPLFLPDCQYDCLNCSKPECDLPDNYYRRQYLKNYREKNKESISQTLKEYRAKNRELLKEKYRKYYKKNHEDILLKTKLRRALPENKKKRSIEYKKYYANHRQQEIERTKRWREENPEKYKAYREKYNQKRREQRAALRAQNTESNQPIV